MISHILALTGGYDPRFEKHARMHSFAALISHTVVNRGDLVVLRERVSYISCRCWLTIIINENRL